MNIEIIAVVALVALLGFFRWKSYSKKKTERAAAAKVRLSQEREQQIRLMAQVLGDERVVVDILRKDGGDDMFRFDVASLLNSSGHDEGLVAIMPPGPKERSADVSIVTKSKELYGANYSIKGTVVEGRSPSTKDGKYFKRVSIALYSTVDGVVLTTLEATSDEEPVIDRNKRRVYPRLHMQIAYWAVTGIASHISVCAK